MPIFHLSKKCHKGKLVGFIVGCDIGRIIAYLVRSLVSTIDFRVNYNVYKRGRNRKKATPLFADCMYVSGALWGLFCSVIERLLQPFKLWGTMGSKSFWNRFEIYLGGLHVFQFTSVGSWIMWFISSWEENNCYVKLIKFTKCQLFSLKMTTLFIQDNFERHFLNLLSFT